MGKISGWIEKLKNLKHLQIIACVAVLTIVLVIYFACASCSDNSSSLSTFGSGNEVNSTDYCSSMQAQVENIVSKISGVGSASVVINWDRSCVQTSFGSNVTENPKAVGALIVCDGGNSTKVKLDVIYAVSTLLDLSIDKIMVYPKSK